VELLQQKVTFDMKQTGESRIFLGVSCGTRGAKNDMKCSDHSETAVTHAVMKRKMLKWLTSISGYLRTCPLTVCGKQREMCDVAERESSQTCAHRCPRAACPHVKRSWCCSVS